MSSDLGITDMEIVAALDHFNATPTTETTMATDFDLYPTQGQTAPDVVSVTSSSKGYFLTGRPSVPLYLSCDPAVFSEYQCLVRKQIELFEAKDEDVSTNAQGRNKPVVLGQVGIRCIHCSMIHPTERTRGAMYYPSKLEGLYQAAQNLANGHLLEGCRQVPETLRSNLKTLKTKKSSTGGGKTAWAERGHALGVYEDECGLRYASRINEFASQHTGHHDE